MRHHSVRLLRIHEQFVLKKSKVKQCDEFEYKNVVFWSFGEWNELGNMMELAAIQTRIRIIQRYKPLFNVEDQLTAA